MQACVLKHLDHQPSPLHRKFMAGLFKGRVWTRTYRVLAIETSCDDSAVCLVNRPKLGIPVLEDHIKITLDSSKSGGVVPIEALAHHLGQIGPAARTILERNNNPKVNLVCATQGPGMFSSLAAGLQVAKGLAIAWNVPFVPVHHMLAHLLTPRFFTNGSFPKFPFLSLLVSGGHTMLVLSNSLFEHRILIDSIDNSIGNSLDKCARALGMTGIMLGKELDQFVGDWEQIDFDVLPADLDIPLALEKEKKRMLKFSFAHFASLLPRLESQYNWHPLASQQEEVRRALGARLEDAMFSHLVRKIELFMKTFTDIPRPIPLLCAGGVAANSRLRTRLKKDLSPLGLEVEFASLEWCTDNALMIGWAGIELFEANHEAGNLDKSLQAIPIAKWPLEEYYC